MVAVDQLNERNNFVLDHTVGGSSVPHQCHINFFVLFLMVSEIYYFTNNAIQATAGASELGLIVDLPRR